MPRKAGALPVKGGTAGRARAGTGPAPAAWGPGSGFPVFLKIVFIFGREGVSRARGNPACGSTTVRGYGQKAAAPAGTVLLPENGKENFSFVSLFLSFSCPFLCATRRLRTQASKGQKSRKMVGNPSPDFAVRLYDFSQLWGLAGRGARLFFPDKKKFFLFFPDWEYGNGKIFTRRFLRRRNRSTGGGPVFQKRLFPIVCATVVLAVLAVVGYTMPEGSRSGDKPIRVVLSKNNGPVVFNHARHEAYGVKCMVCHHDLSLGVEQPRKCADCHVAVSEADFRNRHLARFNRDECIVCHHYTPSMKDWGHDKHVEEYDVECTACHHEDEAIEEVPTNCAECHEEGLPPVGGMNGDSHDLADAVHVRCATCHEKWFKASARGCANCHSDKHLGAWTSRLHRNMNVKDCATCHKRSVEKLVPGRMAAGHTMCVGCHERMSRGPYGKENCSKCHSK